MKKSIIIAAALAVGALITTIAQDSGADAGKPPRGPGGPGGPGRGHRPPPIAIVAALDVNKDGVIDANELANAVAALATLDKNGDGVLTPDEFMGHPQPGGPGAAGAPEGGPRHHRPGQGQGQPPQQ